MLSLHIAGVTFWCAPFSSARKVHTHAQREYPFVNAPGCEVHHLACTIQTRGPHKSGGSVYICTCGLMEYCASQNVTPAQIEVVVWVEKNEFYGRKWIWLYLIESLTLLEDEHQRKRCYLCRFPSVWISPTVNPLLSCFSFRILFPFPFKDIYCLGDFSHDIFQILWRTIVWRLLNHKIKRHFVVYWGNGKKCMMYEYILEIL